MQQNNRRRYGFSLGYMLVALVAAWLFQSLLFTPLVRQQQEVPYSQFRQDLAGGSIKEVVLEDERIYYSRTQASGDTAEHMYNVVRIQDPDLVNDLVAAGVTFQATPPANNTITSILGFIIPFLPMMLIGFILFRRMGQSGAGGPGGVMNFGRSKAKEIAGQMTGVRFADVGGADEVETELQEIIAFLKEPAKFTRLGAKLPKGVLLVGPPGTGKTLLARATAGEAGVPFFTISGSDFVEMFVGVGAARVRDMFVQAKAKAPCIIFIDEIDAIGQARSSAGALASNDEREQTLNQLLSEMDGFDTSKGILILAATNRPEVLDPALLRPGRFDRRVIVEKPDLQGRIDVLKVHAKNVHLDETVDLKEIALSTSGAVGSDLANMINEAAILAVKNHRNAVSQKDLLDSVELVLVGKEKKNRILSKEERRIVSYHEVGHALVSALQKDSEPVQKITIVPRTMGALGYVMNVPEEEKYLNTEKEIRAMLVEFVAGRAAEELVFDTVTTGASNDIEKATKIARAMVTQYGMSSTFGLIGLEAPANQYLDDGRIVMNCSEQTAAAVDQEVIAILKDSYKKAKDLLAHHRKAMDEIAAFLIEKETITGKEFMEILHRVEPSGDTGAHSAEPSSRVTVTPAREQAGTEEENSAPQAGTEHADTASGAGTDDQVPADDKEG